MHKVGNSPKTQNFNQNPYQAYETWREHPFVFWEDYGFPVSARFDVVSAILRDRRFGREAPEGFTPEVPHDLKPFYDFEKHSLLEIEPPEHTRIRAQILRAFTSRRIQSLAPDIEKIAHELIDQFPDGEFDFLTKFAEPLPVRIISRMIGIDESHAPELLAWSHDMVAMYQAGRTNEIERRAVEATEAFSLFIKNIIETRREDREKEDLLTHLLSLEGEKLSFDEIVTTVILLLNAGHEATVHGIGNGVKTLLETGNYGIGMDSEALVEECFRFDTPLHMFTRYAREDITVFDHEFQKGDLVGLLLGGANHDPAKYLHADQYEPNRCASDHLSFGAGIHFCIGAPLARLETRLAFEVLQARCPRLKMTREVVYSDRYHFHGLEALWVSK